MFGLGPWELILLGLIVFLIFGSKRLPEIGKGLGGAVREFREVKKKVAGKSPEEKKESDGEDREKSTGVENKIAEAALKQIPGVKKAMDAKKKLDRVKKMVK